MIKTEYRQLPSRQAAAGPSDLLLLRAMEDVFVSRSSSPEIGQPPSEFDRLVTSDKFGRGLLNGLAISAVIWVSIAASIWQHLQP